ncbi:MAG: PP2C family protein-serine/threonine phosphatase [Acidimicrobiia bacterium]
MARGSEWAPKWWSLHAGALLVLVVGLVLTGSIALGTRLLRNDNEDRLLHQRVNEAATVASSSIAGTQATLTSIAALAETTNGDAGSFALVAKPLTGKQGRFVSASLWRRGTGTPQLLTVVGAAPKLAHDPPARITRVLQGGIAAPTLQVENLLGPNDRRLGYAQSVPSPNARFVVYTETQLPKGRKARIASNSAFADFDYALYLGSKPVPRALLASSNGGTGALTGRQASVTVPFGSTKILLVLAPRTELGGTLLLRLPWALLAFGIVVTLAAAALVERLIRRRATAEDLARELELSAAENARLLAAQRTVASTLQHSLLPETLPEVAGIDLAVRYVAGVEGVDIGGDWYDVLPRDDGQLLFVVGDVSGRGLRAATIMASLRYAIHAYAAQGDSPTDILTKLSKLLADGGNDGFATVLCGTIDVDTREVTIASAGHLPPLLITNAEAELVTILTGVPVGVLRPVPYRSVTISMPPHATLLVFTDGLIERRGESLDVGLERLRTAALGVDGSLEHLLTVIVDDLMTAGPDDDTAVLGVRWRT